MKPHTPIYPENLPVAGLPAVEGSKGATSAAVPPVAGSKGTLRAAILYPESLPAASLPAAEGSKGPPLLSRAMGLPAAQAGPPAAHAGLPALGRRSCAPLHCAPRSTAPGTRLIPFLFNTNEAPPKKLTRSKQSRKHFLFNTFARFFLRPPFAANAARRHPACPEILGEGNPRSGTGEACPPSRQACPPRRGSLSVIPQPSPQSTTIAATATITRPTAPPPPFPFFYCAPRPNLIASAPNIRKRRK
jgi:hypothetical protein